jgi:hypothetical protein
MSQKDERQAAIQKVRKLLSQQVERGATEGQADMAMRKAGELMDAFDITLDEVSLAEQGTKKVVIKSQDGRTYRMGTVSFAIGRFCDCLSYVDTRRPAQKRNKAGELLYSTPRYDKYGRYHRRRPLMEKPVYENHYFGLEPDADTAAYLLEVCREAAKTAVAEFKKTETYKNYEGSKLSLTKSFVEGFASRLVHRINDLKGQREEELARAREARMEMGDLDQASADAEVAAHERRAGRSTDLVALKHKKVENDFKEQFGWVPKSKRSHTGASSWTGRQAGGGAAERVNLSRPVGGGNHSGTLRIGHG